MTPTVLPSQTPAPARAETRPRTRPRTRAGTRGAVCRPAPDLTDENDGTDETDETGETGLMWPAAPMDAAQRAFDLLTRPPAPLAFDCRTIPGLDKKLRFIGLDDLRDLLMADDREPGAESREARPRLASGRVATRRLQVSDAVWRELVTRARRDGPAWVVAAVGVALPGLRRRVRLLSRGWHGEIADLESEMLLGFLERLRTIDVADTGDVNICSRLISAGARAVAQARAYEDDNDAARTAMARSVPPARPWDHPELVLSRAVHAGTITARDATVIARTRLENDTLVDIAAELDVPVDTVTSWRRRAEHRLTEAICDGNLR